MHDGSFKPVEDIEVSDQLMGIDSNPRNVLELKRGKEQMYKINQLVGNSYTVNESHILSLKRSWSKTYSRPVINNERKPTDKVLQEFKIETLNITVKDYLELLKKYPSYHKKYLGYISNCINFDNKDLVIDPYYFGLWLGDGHTGNPRAITTTDPEILNYLAVNYGIKRAHAITYIVKDEENIIKTEFMKLYNLENCSKLKSKYIPHKYLINSKENRLKLLAGLIDSDGYLDPIKNNYEITQKSKQLAYDIVYLCRTLGLRTRIKEKMSKIGDKECGIVYRITFTSSETLPTLLTRKTCKNRDSNKSLKHTRISIEKLEVDDFYGFTLDGDNLFMLEDLTVTHNSGKTTIVEQ
jgi:replicative DNA helicase